MSFLGLLGAGFKATPNEKKTISRTKTARNPIAADIRVFKTGAVYPSAALVSKFNLNYTCKDCENKGNGFDVIDSRAFDNTKESITPFIMIAPVARIEGKVDLFAQTTWDEVGEPNANVLEQGSKAFGVEFWTMVKEIYGTTLTEEQNYMDFTLVKHDAIATELAEATNGIYNVPKMIVRGPLAGSMSYVRRENLDVYILMPISLTNESANVTSNTVTVETVTVESPANTTVNA